MRRRNCKRRSQAQLLVAPVFELMIWVINLVDDENHRLFEFANNARDVLVFIGYFDASVKNHDDDTCLITGKKGLRFDVRGKAIIGASCLDTAGIDELKLMSAPIAIVVGAITRDTNGFVHDRGLGRCETVDKRRLCLLYTSPSPRD